MVVRNIPGGDSWFFFRPFRWDLWLSILATCIVIGFILRILDHPAMDSNRQDVRPPLEHRGPIYWLPFAILAFPERNTVYSNWSRFVLVVWLYMAYVVMQSYTAKLSSIFTLDQLYFDISGDIYIGCQQGSFVEDYLVNQLHFSKTRLRSFSSIEEIHHGLSVGSKNGGYDAIMDEIPYVKLFLNQHASEYRIVGPTYETHGFAFAFPLNSNLVASFSRAILTVTEGSEMSAIQLKNFGPQQYSLANQIDSINKPNLSLTPYNFGGLFIIFALLTIFAIVCSWTRATQRLVAMAVMARQYYHEGFLNYFSTGGNSFRTNSSVHPDPPPPTASDHGQVEMIEEIIENDPPPPPVAIDHGHVEMIEEITRNDPPPGDGDHGQVEIIEEINENDRIVDPGPVHM